MEYNKEEKNSKNDETNFSNQPEKKQNQQIEVSNKNNQIEDTKKEEKKKITKHVEIGNRLIEVLGLESFNNSIYVFQTGVHKIVTDRDLTSCIIKYIDPTITAGQCNNVLFYIKNKLHDENKKEINTDVVNFRNTLFDLGTQTVIAHTSKIFTVNQLSVDYLSNLEFNEEVENYLDELTSHNKVRKKALLQVIGYVLTPKNNIQVMIIFYGPSSSNGKSTLLKIIERIVGPENVCHKSIEKLDTQFGADGIEFKLLNICTEIPKNKIKNIEILKQSITGDTFEATVKYEKNKTIKSYIKHIFASNYLPNVSDDSEAYFRRIHIIPFENRFDVSKSKFNVDKFCSQENLNYLANIAFREYLEMKNSDFQKFANYEESNSIILEYRKKSDSIAAFLTDEFYKEGIYNQNVATKLMFEYYISFCSRSNMKPIGKIKFFKELLEKYAFIRKTIDGKEYFFRKEPIIIELDEKSDII